MMPTHNSAVGLSRRGSIIASKITLNAAGARIGFGNRLELVELGENDDKLVRRLILLNGHFTRPPSHQRRAVSEQLPGLFDDTPS